MRSIAFLNGRVVTVNHNDQIAEAVLVTDKTITAVGTTDEIRASINDNTVVVDLAGRTLLPGFVDAHNHLTHQGAALGAVDFSFSNVNSISRLREVIEEAVCTTAPGKWIRGWGLNHEKFFDRREPTRFDIDDVSPDHPVCAVHVSGHNVLVNSQALRIADIDDDVLDPVGGRFSRNENGAVTGFVYDSAQQMVVPTSWLMISTEPVKPI